LHDYPRLHVVGLAGEFADGLQHLGALDGDPRLVAFLGSTIGNFAENEVAAFLARLRQALRPQDRFLLGVDLLKEPARLLAAYDDAQGVTARFNLNLLARLNRELAADFDLRAFQHRAVFNESQSRIEMHLVSRRAQTVRLGALGLEVFFREGEGIHTENCYKHAEPAMRGLLARHGFRVRGRFCDSEQLFCLYLAS
jgi:dimethylhistidine N-methyltransferase